MSRIPQILVADDDRTVRTVISHALSKQGYQLVQQHQLLGYGIWRQQDAVTS